ncbi:mitochondrial ribosomal protein MRP51 [Ampelomyces quisqualis]|uniref:Mitochondrial ribosomal protein MRP51 n=1 Tax=Ampelomyces quisqualis TaxID=50730 RepID=A0A6A5QDF4_AMPQU|nr:mitochondrial ribosomal protein MRP51 [Ampelomyces quisqualis]
MALRRQSCSPTASLLRSSRLFALPAPLPRPSVGESSGAGITRASDTATLPYPTHQAIATTKSSQARGDWGLKRPLPVRSRLLKASEPVVRVTQLDTIEHVTDFDSASDHVRTRQKWEEMAVPVMKGLMQMRRFDLSGTAPVSAFERRDDTTSYDSGLGLDEAGLYLHALQRSAKKNAKKGRRFHPVAPPPVNVDVHNTKRWKHDGPWLPGMTARDFTHYLATQIATRRQEFNTYLREFIRNEIYATRQLAASQSSEAPPMDTPEAEAWQRARARQWANTSQKDMDAGIKALRRETANNPLASKLVTKLIIPFLRLPTIKFKHTAYAQDAATRDIDRYTFDQESAPLSTHPSAGLSYLRTRAYVANHPILGPQSAPAPIPARVVQPRTLASKKESYAKLGVAGFVANDQFLNTDSYSANRFNPDTSRDVETIDVDTPGGKKVLVQPLFGSVMNDGRMLIKLLRSVGPEVAVARGDLDDRPPVRENVDKDPLRDMGTQKSGVRDLDEQSEKARQLSGYLQRMRPET